MLTHRLVNVLVLVQHLLQLLDIMGIVYLIVQMGSLQMIQPGHVVQLAQPLLHCIIIILQQTAVLQVLFIVI